MLWVVVVAFVVLWPLPVDRHGGALLRRALNLLQRHGLPGWFDYQLVEFAANALMFVPLGLFFFILAPGGWRWLGPAVGFALSVLIEAIQLTALPHRVASPWDVVANTLGAVVGAAAAWGLLRSRHPRG